LSHFRGLDVLSVEQPVECSIVNEKKKKSPEQT
jgi:hypothetical protein